MIETLRLLTLLLTLFQHPANVECIRRQENSIAERAYNASVSSQVPASVILVVAFLESHFGCAAASGGSWGAPVDRNHRLTAGPSEQVAVHSASSLHNGFYGTRHSRGCGTWFGAISYFRCGLCRCPAYRRAPIPPNGDCTTLGRYWKRPRLANYCLRDFGYRAEYVIAKVEELHNVAGIPLPANLTSLDH